MNGKTLKVVEYNLTFGTNARLVDVFGCFKYIKNNRLYVIYADNNSKYNLIYYGSSHVKNNSILCMESNDSKDEEIIKEFIFKVTNKENLDGFEFISLDSIESIEIINSNKLEIKGEVLTSLVDITIPKPEIKEERVTNDTPKKKSSVGKLLPIIIILLVVGGGFLYFTNTPEKNTTIKTMNCKKSYSDDKISAKVNEESIYNFDHNDLLESIDTTLVYSFTEDDYLEFINKGLMYQYMPDANTEGGWDKDDSKFTFSVMKKLKIDSSYSKKKDYEGVLIENKNDGYTCQENIEGE